jgi:hypothetical protein
LDEDQYLVITQERRRRAAVAWSGAVTEISQASTETLSFQEGDLNLICSVLERFITQPNLAFWPPTGYRNLTGAKLSGESGCIELRLSIGAPSVLRPRYLKVERIEEDLSQSFLWLELEELVPLRYPPRTVDNYEGVWEVAPGRYVLNSEFGSFESDDDEKAESPRFITRWYGGHILIISSCSVLNFPRSEEGLYMRFTAAEIKTVIETALGRIRQ